MKKFYFLSFALSALMLGSCSDNDDVVVGGDTTQTSEDGGYVTVKINLPTTASTRANDVYEDGDASEYAVNDATLLLFAGDSESAATLQAAYDLSLSWNLNTTDDNVTSYGQKTVKINSISGKNIMALVVLNKNGLFTIDTSNALTFNGETSAFTSNYSAFIAKGTDLISKVGDFTDDGIFMTNAVLVNQPGSAALTSPATTTLVDVAKYIYEDENEATAHPVQICVERAVAKVEVNDATTSGDSFSIPVSGGSTTDIKYTIEAWELANENTTSYLGRNWGILKSGTYSTDPGDDWYGLASNSPTVLNGTNPYRFAGTVAIDTLGLYRTYFGLDPNYNEVCSFDPITDVDNTPDSYVYCLENTFDVDRQNVNNTTCVIVKAKLESNEFTNGTFYTVGGDATIIYSEDNAKNSCGSKLMSLYSDAELAQMLDDNYADTKTYTDITVSDVVFSGTAAGTVSLTSITLSGYVDGVYTEKEITTATVLEDVATSANVTRYTDGTAYYTVLIKHFGDDLTPWYSDEDPLPSAGNVYPSTHKDANYLGRYGVLRNNWYVIDVTGVSGIGSATIPSVNIDTTTDDELNTYISTKINILSWAKRTQSVTLN